MIVDIQRFIISSSNSSSVLLSSTIFDAGDKPRFPYADVSTKSKNCIREQNPSNIRRTVRGKCALQHYHCKDVHYNMTILKIRTATSPIITILEMCTAALLFQICALQHYQSLLIIQMCTATFSSTAVPCSITSLKMCIDFHSKDSHCNISILKMYTETLPF